MRELKSIAPTMALPITAAAIGDRLCILWAVLAVLVAFTTQTLSGSSFGTGKVVKVMITANDVLHAWALPSFGVKRDAVPGRINETWFKAEKVGTYYGQCSELCGIKHAFMPIEVRVVTEEEYQEWLLDAKVKFAKEVNDEDQFKKLASK
jgi:hypothetical protein